MKKSVKAIRHSDKKLDELFRKKLKHGLGRVKCVTCSTVLDAKEMTVGHWIGRTKYPTRWDPMNAELQCWTCNSTHGGRPEIMEAFLREKYGDLAIDQMIIESNTGHVDRDLIYKELTFEP
jgi:hypothetical protein